MKRLLIILAAIVTAVSCSKDAELCSVVFDCTITTDALPTRADNINDALKSLNPDFSGMELTIGGTKVRIGEETQMYEGLYAVNLLYHPGNGDNWYGCTEAFKGFYIQGFTCDHPSVYINEGIEVVKEQKHYNLHAKYDCCAFVFDTAKIDSVDVTYCFQNVTEADMEAGAEPYVTWTPKCSEFDNLRVFFLCNYTTTENYMLTLYKDGQGVSVPIKGVRTGRYYVLDYGRTVCIDYADWIDGNY